MINSAAEWEETAYFKADNLIGEGQIDAATHPLAQAISYNTCEWFRQISSSKIQPSLCSLFLLQEGWAMIWTKHCSRSNAFVMAGSPSHCYNRCSLDCGKKRPLRGWASETILIQDQCLSCSLAHKAVRPHYRRAAFINTPQFCFVF